MGRGIPHKYRKRRTKSKASKSQKKRREEESIIKTKKLVENIERSKEVHLNNEALQSTHDLPVISAVHGKEYFDKNPFPVQPVEKNEPSFEMIDSIVIKTEPYEEENNIPDKVDESELKTIPETLAQPHLKDLNIPYNQISNSSCKQPNQASKPDDPHPNSNQNTPKISNDEENKLLFDIIKYLDECAKADKFDIGGKLYAAKLRTVPFTNQQAMAENLCRQVLVEAEHFNLDEKIILLKEQPLDHLTNCKTPTYAANKSNLEQSFYLQLEKDNLFQIIEKRLAENTREDRFDKFGNFYATKMRSFSSFQYYCADKLINEIVLTAELGRLRASYRLTKSGDSSPQTFASGKSYAKEYRTKISVLPGSDQTCASNKTQSHVQFSFSSVEPSSAPGNPSRKTFAPRKTYAKRNRKKVSVLPASDVACASNEAQSDKQFTSSFEPSSDPDDPSPQNFAPGKTYAKKCRTEVSNGTCANSKTQSNKQFTYSSTEPTSDPCPQTFPPGKSYAKKHCTKVTVLPVSDGTCASSKTLMSTPKVISVQNNEHKFLESWSSPSVSNKLLSMPDQKKSQSANEQFLNNADKVLSSLFKPSIFPLKSIPAVIPIQNNVTPKASSNLIKVLFLKQGDTLPQLPD